jgi:hypothetical protein
MRLRIQIYPVPYFPSLSKLLFPERPVPLGLELTPNSTLRTARLAYSDTGKSGKGEGS